MRVHVKDGWDGAVHRLQLFGHAHVSIKEERPVVDQKPFTRSLLAVSLEAPPGSQ